MAEACDIFVIGGGINGCGIARDAAGRGYSVVLAEMNDLASGTSSWSTKLVHGGLRYLEYYEFRLVREALAEREVLWAAAPHVIRPMRFVLPHHEGLRPAWLLRLGLFLYDHMGGRKRLPPTRTLDLSRDPAGAPLRPGFRTAFEYSDCVVDDARLVVLNARDAAERGADIRPRCRCVAARREGDAWRVTVEDKGSGAREEITARVLVNAAGPWVDTVLREPLGQPDARNVRLVQGSHIVVPKLFAHERSYIFQQADGRIVFAIPYQDGFTLIGTTDRDYSGDPADAAITPAETAYLLNAANGHFRKTLRAEDVVWSFSGVRPLYDDGASAAQEATRDYVLKLERTGDAALLNVFGGKLTTYRRLAESALVEIESVLGARGPAWTKEAALPGGAFPVDGLDALADDLRGRWPFLDAATAARLARSYGTCAKDVLGDAKEAADMGEDFGAGLTAREVAYLAANEWAATADDILWRRSKLGLFVGTEDVQRLERWLAAQGEGRTP